MMRIYAAPAWQLLELDRKKSTPDAPREQPLVPALGEASLEAVLGRAEYRGEFAYERATTLLEGAQGPVVFARPPGDLPALLRTADQLLRFNRQEAGERALVWRCDCGARYAVPVSLFRPVAIRCERCDRTIELDSSQAQGEAHAADPARAQLSAARVALSEFFREAMFRGWLVALERA